MKEIESFASGQKLGCWFCDYLESCQKLDFAKNREVVLLACHVTLLELSGDALELDGGELVREESPKQKESVKSLFHAPLQELFRLARRATNTEEGKGLLNVLQHKLCDIYPKTKKPTFSQLEEQAINDAFDILY